MIPQRWLTLPALAGAALTLAACGPGLLIGAGVTTGLMVAEERSLGQQIDDFTIKMDISERLFAFDESLSRAVSVDVTEGRTLLTGMVDTPRERVDAVRIAWQAEGVKEVINEIQVADEDSLDGYLTDARISGELRAELLLDRDIPVLNYNVETVGGVVYITGIAQDRDELERVVSHARRIAGVRQVVSHVRVKAAGS